MTTFQEVMLTIDIHSLADSPYQYRKDYQDIEALAKSIEEQGLLQTPVARLKPGLRKRIRKETSYGKKLEGLSQSTTPCFELAFGHRRIRALLHLAQNDATFFTLKLPIRDLSDEEMREIALTENLQRHDIHPYHLSVSVAQMVTTAGGATAVVAKKLGKTKRWVLEHIRFLELPQNAIELWLSGVLTAAHIKILVKYPPATVNQVLPQLITEETEWDEARENRIVIGHQCHKTPKDFEKFFKEKVQIPLAQAQFDLSREDWLFECNNCLQCPFNTHNQATLFPEADARQGICTQPACFQSKSVPLLTEKLQLLREQGHTVYLISSSWYASQFLVQAYKDSGESILDREDYSTDLERSNGQKLAPQAIGLYCNWSEDSFLNQVPIVLKGEYKDTADSTLETWLGNHQRKLHNRQLRRENQIHKDDLSIDQKVAFELAKIKGSEELPTPLVEMLFGIIFSWSSSENLEQLIQFIQESWLITNQIEAEEIPSAEQWKYLSIDKWKSLLTSSQQYAAIRFLLLMASASNLYSLKHYFQEIEAEHGWIREGISEEFETARLEKWAKQDEKQVIELEKYHHRMREINELANDPDSWFAKCFIQGDWEILKVYQNIEPRFVAKKARLLKIKLKSAATDEEVIQTFQNYQTIVLEELKQWRQLEQQEQDVDNLPE